MKWCFRLGLANKKWDCGYWRNIRSSDTHLDNRKPRYDKVGIEIETKSTEENRNCFNRAIAAVRVLNFFPKKNVLCHLCAPEKEEGAAAEEEQKIAAKATIIQKYFFGPFGFISALRVVEVFDQLSAEGHEFGFEARIVQEGPLKGRIRFCIRRKSGKEAIRMKVESWILPNHWSAGLLWPIMAAWFRKVNAKALDALADQSISQKEK